MIQEHNSQQIEGLRPPVFATSDLGGGGLRPLDGDAARPLGDARPWACGRRSRNSGGLSSGDDDSDQLVEASLLAELSSSPA